MVVTNYRYCILTWQIDSEAKALDTKKHIPLHKELVWVWFFYTLPGDTGTLDATHALTLDLGWYAILVIEKLIHNLIYLIWCFLLNPMTAARNKF